MKESKAEEIVQDCMDKLARLKNSASMVHDTNAVAHLMQAIKFYLKRDKKCQKTVKNIGFNVLETDVRLVRTFSHVLADNKLTKRERKAFDEDFLSAEIAMLEMRSFIDKHKD